MKRITTILSLIAMIFVSGISYADDINLFLNNRADSTDASTKPQVLFLIDILEKEVTNECTLWTGSGGGGGGTVDISGCYDPTDSEISMGEIQVMANMPNITTNNLQFRGLLCTNDKGAFDGDTFSRECTTGLKLLDPRPVIEEIMLQRPDAKFGVMTLKVENDDPATTSAVEPTVRSAELVLEVKSRTTKAELDAAIEDLKNGSSVTKIDGSSVPTAGGLAKVYDYLHGDTGKPSPLTSACENLHLVMITNGGWKDDATPSATSLKDIAGVTAPDTTSAAFLQQIAAKFRDNSATGTGCDAKISTSVIGLNVATNDTTNFPLFKVTGAGDAATSPAMEMAKVGQGVYINTVDEKIIVNEVLGLLDFSYPTPSALISPSSPVSVSRSHNLSLLFASAFKPEGKIAWPGNMTTGTVAEWTDAGGNSMDPTQFDVDSTDTFTDIAGLSGITIKTDLCAGGATALCTLSDTNSTILTSDDVAWLRGSTLDNNEVFGDPIHFKTLAIHYGDVDGDGDALVDHDDNSATPKTHTPDAKELYVLVGTNRGLLHMFEYTAGTLVHKWAFFPKELERMIPALRNGNLAPSYNMVNHFYGIDGAPSVFIYDAGKDGKIKPDADADNADDRVLLYFGLRRGGTTYYALDITSPLTPKLQWSRGKATADYGTKPDAEMKEGDDVITTPETKEVGGNSGGCPVWVMRTADGNLSSNLASTCTNVAGQFCLNPAILGWPDADPDTGESYEEALAAINGSQYQGGAIYYKGIIPGRDLPWMTFENQCRIDLPAEGSHTFDAHPLGMGSQAKGHAWTDLSDPSCVGAAIDDAIPYYDGSMGVGYRGQHGHTDAFVGFDLSSLPDGAQITSAKLTFAHQGIGSLTEANALYDEGIALFISKKGFYGKDAGREDIGCEDYKDLNHYEFVGEVGKSDSGIQMGARTTKGEIFSEYLFPHLYEKDGNSTDAYISALTQVFNKTINDNKHKTAWVQFRASILNNSPYTKAGSNTTASNIAWGAPRAGHQISDWQYDDKVANPGTDSYWNSVVPKLTLSWTQAAPSSEALDGDMSIDKADFITRSGGSSPIQLTLNVQGTGSVSVNNDGVTTTCSDSSPGGQCTITATAESIVLSVVGDGLTFTGWSVCDSLNGTTCTMNMTESKTLTANFSTVTTYLLNATVSAPGGDNTVAGFNVTDGIAVLTSNASIVADKQIKLTAEADTGYSFANWTGTNDAKCGDSSPYEDNPCTFTMDSAVSLRANFVEVQGYLLTVNGAANGTVATSLNGSGSVDCSSGCTEAGEYTIEFTPDTAAGYVIGSIAGCEGAPGCTLTRTLDADNPTVELSADFQKAEYTVTVTADPSDGGTISVSPDSIEHNTIATISVDPGTNTITGVTSSGCTVTKVSDDSSTIATYETDAITSNDCQVTATFAAGSSCDVLASTKTCTSLFYPYPELTKTLNVVPIDGCSYTDSNPGWSTGWLTFTCSDDTTGESCVFKYGKYSGTISNANGSRNDVYTHEKDSKYYKSDACSNNQNG